MRIMVGSEVRDKIKAHKVRSGAQARWKVFGECKHFRFLSRCTHTVIAPFYFFRARAHTHTHQFSDGAFGIDFDSPQQQCDDLEGRGKDQSTCHAADTCIHMRLRTVKSQNQRYAHASGIYSSTLKMRSWTAVVMISLFFCILEETWIHAYRREELRVAIKASDKKVRMGTRT